MTRAILGAAALVVVFAVPGMALLYALGFLRGARDVGAALGAAFVSGLALVLPILIVLLVLGAPVELAEVLVVAASASVVCLLVGRRTRGRREPAANAARTRIETWVGRALLGAFGAYAALGVAALAKAIAHGHDDWGFWSYKAIVLYQYGGRLRPDVFAGGIPGPRHLDYPVLQPLLESIFFRTAGGVHVQEWHIVPWLVFVAFLWLVAFLARSRGVHLAALTPVAVLGLSPFVSSGFGLGRYSDVTWSCFAAAGVLCLGFWLSGAATRYAVLAGILFAAAANTKNEGMTTVAIAVVAAAAVLVATRRARWRPLAGSAAIALAGTLPWILWRSAHSLGNADARPLGQALDPGFLLDRLGRLSYLNRYLLSVLAAQEGWLWIAPSFIALAVVCIVARVAWREATFYLATMALTLASLYWVFWTGRLGIGFWLATTSPRILTGVVFVATVGLVHLLATTVASPRRAAAAT